MESVIEKFAEKHRLRVSNDECGELVISGRKRENMEYRRRGTPAPDFQVNSDSLDPCGLSAGARGRAGRSRPFSHMAT
jgi:hypothetical protein